MHIKITQELKKKYQCLNSPSPGSEFNWSGVGLHISNFFKSRPSDFNKQPGLRTAAQTGSQDTSKAVKTMAHLGPWWWSWSNANTFDSYSVIKSTGCIDWLPVKTEGNT